MTNTEITSSVIHKSTADELCQLTASAAVELLRAGEIAPLDLVDAAINRIERVDSVVNALPLRRFEAARNAAKAFKGISGQAGSEVGWLAGLPIAVKDYNDLAGLPTTCGSPIYANSVPAQSDLVVENLERHGAIPIAKSNVPEFAGANTFNTVFGATRNPWNPVWTVGGSSGGSAAALAAGMVWLATGSDLGGSLRIPASYCGIVGMRPSVGRVARPTVMNPYDPLLVEGPMGRCVADVALMLDAQANFDSRDPLSFSAPAQSFVDAVRHPIAPRRVGFTPNLGLGKVEREVAHLCQAATQRFAELGAVVDDGCPDFRGGIDAFQVLRANMIAGSRGELLDVHRDQICPEIIWNIEKGLNQSGKDVAVADRVRSQIFRSVSRFFDDYDILACPTVAVAPFPVSERFPTSIDGQELESYIDWMYLTFVLTLTGCPVISVPVGLTSDGRPVGLQLMGRPRGDHGVLAAAQLIEGLLPYAKQVPRVPA
jgi:amidase